MERESEVDWLWSATSKLTLLSQLEPSSADAVSGVEAARCPAQSEQVVVPSVSEQSSFAEQHFAMDFSDTLFSTFNQMFPDPKEICN